MTWSGKQVLVAGMGKSGFAAAQLLHREGARLVLCDERPPESIAGLPAQLAAWNAQFRPQQAAAFAGVDLIVLSPGVPVEVVPPGAPPVIGEVELASYFLRGPVIGITGTNGKTTTTSLVFHILRASGIPAQLGGNIGTPPTAMIETSRDDQWNVLELSSFQLETIHRFQARLGACLNLTQNHLDRHGTLERYAAAKRRLVETMDEKCCAVLNADDATTLSFAAHTRARVHWFSAHHDAAPGVWLRGDQILEGETPLLPVADIPLKGRHNIENVMAAAALARLAGATPREIREAVRTFAGVEHRLEFVRRLRGVSYYNDSKATSVDACQKAIDAFPGGLWIILGGKDKGSDYRVLRDSLAAKARAALLIGAAAAKIAGHLRDALPLVPAGTLDHAVAHAAQHAQPGDTVLLAPACASFDQFDSFEHRGRVFKTLVAALPGED
jgi:UDP-N-acetylmuramoylalanine--D-glutamate ligase